MKTLIGLTIFSLIALNACDATFYPGVNCSDESKLQFKSWHIHVPYWPSLNQHREAALALRQQLAQAFGLRDCDNINDPNPKSCLLPDNIRAENVFFGAQWGVYITLEDFSKIGPWMQQRIYPLDMQIHPNTGCPLLDHTKHLIWAGQNWQLDLTKVNERRTDRRRPNRFAFLQDEN